MVVSLLRHLPQIDRFPDCQQCKNGDEDVKTLQMVSENPDICDEMPSHAVGLAQGLEESPNFLLDTKFGVIHEW